MNTRVLIVLQRNNSVEEHITIKAVDMAPHLFTELVEDPERYQNVDPFDEQAYPWLETQSAQDLRRALVSLFDSEERHNAYFACSACPARSECFLVLHMRGSEMQDTL